jgi:division/cell wall cluster transcriptional repressor MraZ
MRRTHVGIILAGALVGVLAALITARLKHQPAPEPTEFVSADGREVIELPGEPTPLPSEPEPVTDTGNPVLLEPVPMTGIEVTVGHRSAEPAPEGDDTQTTEAEHSPCTIPGPGVPEELPMPAPVETKAEDASGAPPATHDAPASTEALSSVVPEPVPAPEEAPAPGVAVAPAQAPAPPQSSPCGQAPASSCEQEPVSSEASTVVDQAKPADASPAPATAAVPAAVAPVPMVRPGPLPLPALVMAAARKHASHADQVPATGTYECNLEKQAELKLSPGARAELDRPRVLFVALAPDKKCLWVYTTTGIEHLADQLDHNSGGTAVAHCTRRKCFSRLQPVHATTDGTFVLPVELVDVACLKGNVLLIGVRDHFELWDAHQWQQYIGQEEPAEQPEGDGGHATGGTQPENASPVPDGVLPASGSLLDQAKQAEASGNVAKAIELYTQVYRQNVDANHALAMDALNRVHFLQNGYRPPVPPGYQARVPGQPVSTTQVSYAGAAPVVQPSGPGQLRRAGFFVNGKQAYVLENTQGRPLVYVTAQAGLNLEPYVNRNVEVFGPVIFHGDLRNNYMTATQVNLLQ